MNKIQLFAIFPIKLNKPQKEKTQDKKEIYLNQ